MFYDNRKTIVYKVIGSVIYTIIENYIYIYFLYLLQDKLSKHNNKFENTKFKNISGLVIPDIFINIMPCHGVSKSSILTFILTCHSVLVPYYLSKIFVIV